MAKKNKDDVSLTKEQLSKAEQYLYEKAGEKDEVRIPKWVNSVLENDRKVYFSDDGVSKSAVASCALYAFNTYLTDQKDKTQRLLEIADNYAYTKYHSKTDVIDTKNVIANLKPQDFIYLDNLNKVFNTYDDDDETVKLRITPTNKNAWILSIYKDYLGKYGDENQTFTRQVVSVLTWYASFPGYKREQIIKQEVYADIQKALTSKEESGRYYDCYMESGNIMTLCPYKIVTHNEGIHNYLVGVGDEEHYTPTSLRLDRISKIVPNYTIPTKKSFSAQEKDILDSMIKYGPEFAYPSFNKPTTVIRLSEQAQKMYSRIYIHRPVEVSKTKNDDGTVDYTFDCTEQQLSNYFKKFEAEYKILQSETLKDSLLTFYKNAAKMLK